MNCEQIEKELVACALGEAEMDVQREVRTHLEGCPACRRKMSLIQAAASALPERTQSLSPDFTARVMERIDAEEAAARRNWIEGWLESLRLNPSLGAAAACLAGFLLFGGLFVGRWVRRVEMAPPPELPRLGARPPAEAVPTWAVVDHCLIVECEGG